MLRLFGPRRYLADRRRCAEASDRERRGLAATFRNSAHGRGGQLRNRNGCGRRRCGKSQRPKPHGGCNADGEGAHSRHHLKLSPFRRTVLRGQDGAIALGGPFANNSSHCFEMRQLHGAELPLVLAALIGLPRAALLPRKIGRRAGGGHGGGRAGVLLNRQQVERARHDPPADAVGPIVRLHLRHSRLFTVVTMLKPPTKWVGLLPAAGASFHCRCAQSIRIAKSIGSTSTARTGDH